MSTRDYRRGIEGMTYVFGCLQDATSVNASLLDPPLLRLLVSRVTRAIGEGMPILEGECSRRALVPAGSETAWSDASLVHALEIDLGREENTSLRWLVISYWVVLCSFDGIAANVEVLVGSDPRNVVWLVAGALWVQLASGQPTTYELREALARLRARGSSLDVGLAATLAGPPSASREAAEIVQQLLSDPAAVLPTPNFTALGEALTPLEHGGGGVRG